VTRSSNNASNSIASSGKPKTGIAKTGTTKTGKAEPLLEFRGVRKTFGSGETAVHAVRSLDLIVHAGEFVVVMGPSGCGKSTMLHLAAGLETATEGSVALAGEVLERATRSELAALRRRNVGVVFQRLNLVPELTILENVMLPLELDGMSTREARPLAESALADVELSLNPKRFPDEISGGQQQRVALARAIVGPRRLVLADEPTASLDSATSDRVIDLLATLVERRGITVVLVTHESRFAAWANRVIHMRDGEVLSDHQTHDFSTDLITHSKETESADEFLRSAP
jgi:putative ABC transport system ATP-binding protein